MVKLTLAGLLIYHGRINTFPQTQGTLFLALDTIYFNGLEKDVSSEGCSVTKNQSKGIRCSWRIFQQRQRKANSLSYTPILFTFLMVRLYVFWIFVSILDKTPPFIYSSRYDCSQECAFFKWVSDNFVLLRRLTTTVRLGHCPNSVIYLTCL